MNGRSALRSVVLALLALIFAAARVDAAPVRLDAVFAPDQSATELQGYVRGASEPVKISIGGVVGEGALAPDGRRLLFLEVAGDDIALSIVNVDGSGHKRLLGLPVMLAPSWAPDGKSIVFTSVDVKTHRTTVETVGLDGKRLQAVKVAAVEGAVPDVRLFKPHLSRDGKSVLASGIVTRNGKIVPLMLVIDRKTGATRELARGIDGTWSPDGKHLAYLAVGSDGKAALTVAAADGKKPRPVGVKRAFAPTWSPDGQRLYFNVMTEDDELAVWSANADGTSPTLVKGIPAGALLSPTSKNMLLKYLELRGK